MRIYGDIVMHVERLGDGGWTRVPDLEFRDRGGGSFRRLQDVGGLDALARAEDVPSIALTLRELLAARWEEPVTNDGFIHFRAHSSWDNTEPYVEWRKTSPRRAPRTYHAGDPGGVAVSEAQAEAALARASEEAAEQLLFAEDREAESRTSRRVYVLVNWTETQRERNASMVELIEKELASLGEPAAVRLVFTSPDDRAG